MRNLHLQQFYKKIGIDEQSAIMPYDDSNEVEKQKQFAENVVTLFDSFLNSEQFNVIKATKSPMEIFDTAAIMTHAAIHEKLEQQGKIDKHPALLTISEYAEYFDNLRNEDPERFDIEFKEFQDNPPQDYIEANEILVAEQLGLMFMGDEPSRERKMFNMIQDILVQNRLPAIQLEFKDNARIPYKRPRPGMGMPGIGGPGMPQGLPGGRPGLPGPRGRG
jgi:hypothetical protein